MTTDTQLQRARELLANAYRKAGRVASAERVTSNNGFRCMPPDAPELEAILAALSEQQAVQLVDSLSLEIDPVEQMFTAARVARETDSMIPRAWVVGWAEQWEKERRTLIDAQDKPTVQHLDDAAVDRFAAAMKEKMAEARAKGRSGWDDPEQCSTENLSRMLVEHVAKGDPRDVANFCMMLWNRGDAIKPAEQGQRPVAWQIRLIALKKGAMEYDWRPISEAEFNTTGGKPTEGTHNRCEFRALYAAPQPAVAEDEEGDMFWLAEDSERCVHSLVELIDDADDGAEIEVQTAIGLPNFWIRVIQDDEGTRYERLAAKPEAKG